MRKIYNQNALTLTIDGQKIQDYMDGSPVIFTFDGGEVQKTQGTDGPSINLATNQGVTIQFTLRETSRSLAFCIGLRQRQEMGGPGVSVIGRTGADIIVSLIEGYISRPGQLTTGDKMQGGMQFTITAANDTLSGLNIENITFGAVAPQLGL